MKSLSEPLLDVQLKDPDTLETSPLRDFATDILVGNLFRDASSGMSCLIKKKKKKERE